VRRLVSHHGRRLHKRTTRHITVINPILVARGGDKRGSFCDGVWVMDTPVNTGRKQDGTFARGPPSIGN